MMKCRVEPTLHHQGVTLVILKNWLAGLVGCFLTAVAGVTGSMLIFVWVNSDGWLEWLKRLALGYLCACLAVLGIFPVLVPWLTQH